MHCRSSSGPLSTPRNGWALALLLLPLMAAQANAQGPLADSLEFFEARIRPVLAAHCYECHNSANSAEGGLALDHRAAMLEGGGGGAILVPGQPDQSRLLAVLRHEVDGLAMPQGGARLPDHVIADFERWIAAGAVDPRDKPPSPEELSEVTSWPALLALRKQWWSFQPIQTPAIPNVQSAGPPEHPVDRFVLAKLEEHGLVPSPPASPEVLVRRLFLVLIGLPPTVEECCLWTERLGQADEAERDRVVAELVDSLLARPHFGEKWARHWMDWIRYAESHGSEGDPVIENAWHYRDYLIRALNADVPYDQLVREHVAGDLLESPRINHELGINESLIGPAHWRMVFHGFAPTDALDEKVRFVDDQINAFSKAFLGLTVSCARCHHHKFDPISQDDYYALFGVLGSCRPGRVLIDVPERQDLHRDRLRALKPRIRDLLAETWLSSLSRTRESLLARTIPEKKEGGSRSVLQLWFEMRRAVEHGTEFSEAWQQQVVRWEKTRTARHHKPSVLRAWELSKHEDYASWFTSGNGLPDQPQAAGEFAIQPEGDEVLLGIYPSGVYSHSLSTRHAARLTSPDFHLDGEYELWLRVVGDGGATVRYVVHDYPRSGTVYPVPSLTPQWRWQRFDVLYWKGDDLHLELATSLDAPLLVSDQPRSWFGIREAIIQRKDEAAPVEPRAYLDPLFLHAQQTPPTSLDALADLYLAAAQHAIRAWRNGTLTDGQAELLDQLLREELLPNELSGLSPVKPLVEEYRRLEQEIPVPTRVPGLEEAVGQDQPLMVRGDHKQTAHVVPRRFLEAIDSTPYETPLSGRRELAEDLLREDNPLVRRVIVNRLWHHLFGQGLVATPDNFGQLGSQPTHPELLDWLATRLSEEGWSLKKMIRLLVTSETWQRSSLPSPEASQRDPGNLFLSHSHLRRLEAEGIRDSLLSVAGELDRTLYGAPVDSGSRRRSIYLAVRRNSLEPFLRIFDFPEPFSTTGRRTSTNVPAQSLALMNDPQVIEWAQAWADQVLGNPALTNNRERIQAMFLAAFARPATESEIAQVENYLDRLRHNHDRLRQEHTELRQEIARRRHEIEQISEPVRQKLLAREQSAEESDSTTPANSNERLPPAPIAAWDFEHDLRDSIGTLHGTAFQGARIEDGALVVRDSAYVVTPPLAVTLHAKTLEAWVQLDELDQRGGGVISIQSPDGRFFDAIVYGERDPRQWIAGSDLFRRTQPFGGSAEVEAFDRPVHIAIAYHPDGRIAAYRNGRLYGQAYGSEGPQEFRAGEAVIGFGLRHLPALGNRLLNGRIFEARLYDQALTEEQLNARFLEARYYVSEKEVLAQLADPDRERVAAHQAFINQAEERLAADGELEESPRALWIDLARALLTFKEFIYIR